MTKTFDDLQAAFAGESQANRKYLAYAKKADAEGYPQIARLFRGSSGCRNGACPQPFSSHGRG